MVVAHRRGLLAFKHEQHYIDFMSPSIQNAKKKKRGRPKTTGVGLPIGIRWHPPELKAIDDWRREEPDIPSRHDAIRRLVRLGLAAKRRNPA